MILQILSQRLRRSLTSFLVQQVRRDDARRRRQLPQVHGGLPPSLWDCAVDDAGEMTLHGRPLSECADRFGTPLHVVDRQRLVRNLETFQEPFRRVHAATCLATSYKTNPLPRVLTALHSVGSLAEVISHFELWLALRLGVPGERIIFNGPGKTADGLRAAVAHDVGMINMDGLHEVPIIAGAGAESGKRQRVGLRVVTSVGWSGQFGVPLAGGEAIEAFRRMQREPSLHPVGLHLHLGTGIKHIDTYVTAVEEVLDFGRRLQTDLGIRIECYDFGGGFGVPTVRDLSTWDQRLIQHGHAPRLAFPADCPSPSDYADALAPLFRRYFNDAGAGPRIVFEPGRAITSSAQLLLLTVLAVKPGRDGTRMLILDGGKNVSMPLEWETHQIFPVDRMSAPANQSYDLYGPLCHPGDVLCRRKPLPEMFPGDRLAVMDAGAYFVPNQLNFSQPRPAAILLDDGRAELIRERESFDDLVRLDRIEEEGR